MAYDAFYVTPGTPLSGVVRVPGDKSIAHRAVLFTLLATGTAHIRDWLPAGDTEASLRAVAALGVEVERHSPFELTLHSSMPRDPVMPLDLVNAGTGIRLLAGILCGQPFTTVLDGSEQLRRRPMRRIIDPLRMMGADINGQDGRAPLTIRPASLHGVTYDLPVASAQVKSALLLAGLFANGETRINQPGPARDHTERMLSAMGADIVFDAQNAVIRPGALLRTIDVTVPGDASSAAFLIVAALIVPDSAITITNVNLNPTRTGIFEVLTKMGADLQVVETGVEAGEPVGTIHAHYSSLHGVAVDGDIVVRMIDEFPALMVAALTACGRTTVRDAAELRVKETDRLAVMTTELRKLGAVIEETPDGSSSTAPKPLLVVMSLDTTIIALR